MKLARPDVFHPRVVLAGWPQQPAGDGDDAGLVAALRHRGLHAGWLSWDDPEIVHADLVILRATRDYPARLDEFLAWTTRVANLLNSRPVVAWNVERRYLRDLMDRGVPTVPGEVYVPGEPVRLPRKGQVFVGPTIGTGTRRCSARFAAEFVAQLHAAGQAVLVQPGGSGDETVLVFLGGERRMRLPSRPTLGARPSPTSKSGTWVRPPWPARPRRWVLTQVSCSTRGPTSQVEAEIPGCWNCNWWTRRWAGSGWTQTSAILPSVTSRYASSQRWSGWGWARSPIDAHSAAVAAVTAAAPAT